MTYWSFILRNYDDGAGENDDDMMIIIVTYDDDNICEILEFFPPQL